MCYLTLFPDEKVLLEEAKIQYKCYKNTFKHLDKNDLLYEHKRIMFSRLAVQWRDERNALIATGKRRTWSNIKYKLNKMRRRLHE